MAASTPEITKRETLNLRIKPEERGLIDRAAQLLGENLIDFMLEAPAGPPRKHYWARP